MNNFDYWDNEFTPVYGSVARRGRNCTKGVPCGNSCQRKGSVCRSNLTAYESKRYDQMSKYVSQYDNMVKKGKPLSKVQKSEHRLARKERDRLAETSQKLPRKERREKIAEEEAGGLRPKRTPRKRRTPIYSDSEIDRMSKQELREKMDTMGEFLKGLNKIERDRAKREGSGRKGSRHLEPEYSEVFVDSRYPNLLGVEYVRELTDDLPDATIVVSDYETGVISDGEFIPISLRELDAFFGEDEEFTPVYGVIAKRGKNCTKGVPCGNSCQKRGSACRKNMSAMDIKRYDNMTKAIKRLDRQSKKPGGLTKAQASEKSLWERKKKDIAWNSKNKD